MVAATRFLAVVPLPHAALLRRSTAPPVLHDGAAGCCCWILGVLCSRGASMQGRPLGLLRQRSTGRGRGSGSRPPATQPFVPSAGVPRPPLPRSAAPGRCRAAARRHCARCDARTGSSLAAPYNYSYLAGPGWRGSRPQRPAVFSVLPARPPEIGA
eukprot:COSAG01_NODE_5179_length_4429_cov_81.248730_5_plen_156_part_00